MVFFFSKTLVVAWMKMIGKCWYWQRNKLINNLASVFPAEPGKANWVEKYTGKVLIMILIMRLEQTSPYQYINWPLMLFSQAWWRGPGKAIWEQMSEHTDQCNFSQRYECLTFRKNKLTYFAVFIWEQVIRLRRSVYHLKLFVSKTLFVLHSQKCHSVSWRS